MTLIKLIEVMAVLVGAFSGFAEARRKKMDLVGVYTVAFITAFGGGTLRDILLDYRPLFWVEHYEYPILICVLSVLAVPLMKLLRKIISEDIIVIADAIGLGLFAIAGTAKAILIGMPAFIAVMMGVITGICGGVLRDIICNEVPMVFRDGQPYALCAFAGCWLYLALDMYTANAHIALWSSAVLITALRLVAWKLDMKIR